MGRYGSAFALADMAFSASANSNTTTEWAASFPPLPCTTCALLSPCGEASGTGLTAIHEMLGGHVPWQAGFVFGPSAGSALYDKAGFDTALIVFSGILIIYR